MKNHYNSLQESEQRSAGRTYNNHNKEFDEETAHDDEKVDFPKFENTDKVSGMSASEFSEFLNEIVDNHIKSKKKIDSDL